MRKWGDTTYPIKYVYDEYSRMTQLKTYRAGSGWNQPTWPTSPGDADVTTWLYQESTGLLLQKIYDDGNGTSYEYDSAGRLTKRTWDRSDDSGNPLETVYIYDPATGDQLSINYSDSTPDISYTYNRLGQQKTVTDTTGTRTFTYSPATLKLESEELPATFYGDDFILDRSYNSYGNEAGYTLSTDNRQTTVQNVSYGYDGYGRFSSVTSNAETFSYGYLNNSDLIETVTYPYSISRTITYESNRNLIDVIENKHGLNAISKFDYENDGIGRRTDVITSGAAFAFSSFNHYSYNTRSEVTGGQKYNGADITDMSNPEITYDYDYSYDNLGNRLSYSDAGTSTDYTANSLNQYTQITENTVPQVVKTPTYDTDGNMTSDGGDWTYTWNCENRLIVAESADTKLEFAYDYIGRRVKKDVYSWEAGTSTFDLQSSILYLYDGWNLIYEKTTNNEQQSTNTYTWGLDLSQTLQGAGGVGGLLSVHTQSKSSPSSPTYDVSSIAYATMDANGNISEYLDSTGTIAAHYEYSPFGGLTLSVGSKTQDFVFRFSTKYLDNHTNLYYYGYRYYNPSIGCWMNRDPLEETGGINLYCFVLNNAANEYDLLGLSSDDDDDSSLLDKVIDEATDLAKKLGKKILNNDIKNPTPSETSGGPSFPDGSKRGGGMSNNAADGVTKNTGQPKNTLSARAKKIFDMLKKKVSIKAFAKMMLMDQIKGAAEGSEAFIDNNYCKAAIRSATNGNCKDLNYAQSTNAGNCVSSVSLSVPKGAAVNVRHWLEKFFGNMKDACCENVKEKKGNK